MFPTAASNESVSVIQQLLNNYVAARWYQMGVVMGVPPSDLEIIRESPDYQGAGEREGAMLRAWLERGLLPKTWQVHVYVCMHIYVYYTIKHCVYTHCLSFPSLVLYNHMLTRLVCSYMCMRSGSL